MKTVKYFVFGCLFFISVSGAFVLQANAESRGELEERVQKLVEKSHETINLRRNVESVFKLADIYFEEGNEQKAMELYKEALRVDSTRYNYQLKYAKLLLKFNKKDIACDTLSVIDKKCGDIVILSEAEKLVKENNIFIDKNSPKVYDTNINITLVPAKGANTDFINRLPEELHRITGINYVISKKKVKLCRHRRTEAEKFTNEYLQMLKKTMNGSAYEYLLKKFGTDEHKLKLYYKRKKFIINFIKSTEPSRKRIKIFKAFLKKLEKKKQIKTTHIMPILKKKFKKDNKINGYLLVTAEDMYARDDENYLFGTAGGGYGVISYHRFLEKPEKGSKAKKERFSRLALKRTVKQAVSSSFFILGIKRCTNSECIRAYPNSLDEHDGKGCSMCNWCAEQLKLNQK